MGSQDDWMDVLQGSFDTHLTYWVSIFALLVICVILFKIVLYVKDAVT